jgi:hypothetical protein
VAVTEQGNELAKLVTFATFAIGPALIMWLRGRWGVVAGYALAWMFLPMSVFDWPGLPPLNKATTTAVALMLGCIAFDFKRLAAYRFSVWDLPVLLWCAVPFVSIMFNGPWDPPGAPKVSGIHFYNKPDLTAYDALATTVVHSVTWLTPWILGRVYLATSDAHKDVCWALFFFGLIYAPLCMFESRMSPQLHNLAYGFHQHDFSQTYRMGGWRPMVFMEHGLMTAFWMMSATVAGYTIWRFGLGRPMFGFRFVWPLTFLVLNTINCRSFGAWLQLAASVLAIHFAAKLRRTWLIAAIALLPILYITARAHLGWDGSHIVRLVEPIAPERAESFAFRLFNENILAEHAAKRPWLGWGGYDRNRLFDEQGKDISVTDGLWIMTLGTYGLIGLTALYAVLLPGPVLAMLREPNTPVSGPRGCTLAVATLALMFAADGIANAMQNPFYILMAGGCLSYAQWGWRATPGVRA